ncbi:MAG TPA: DUF4910 domain-containing protein [Candidatus Xenobia bacterium]|nr:DUF4910 domain-containing protein [Candidatus Xenobia bacterium]
MRRRLAFLLAGCLLASGPLCSQTYAPPKYLVSEELFQSVTAEYSGSLAKEYVIGITRFHRIQASPGFTEAREYVVAQLKQMGVTDVEVETFPSDGKRRYQTYVSPLAWTVRSAELWMTRPQRQRLCNFRDVPMCLTTLSNGGEWRGEVVDVGRGTSAADYEGKDVQGKVVLATGYAGIVHREAVIARGALGVLIRPREDDRPEHPDMARYNGLWLKWEEKEKAGFGFQLSHKQAEHMKGFMDVGQPVEVQAKVDAELHAGQLEVTNAFFRGSEKPEQEIILIGHLDHPKWSANDNGSGSGALLEIARTLKTLIDQKKVTLRRTIRIMWVPEHFGTIAWLDAHRDIGQHAIAVLNLDMVGEDLYKTNSRLRITRTPDSLPSFLNDLVENVAAQTAAANLTDPAGSKNLFHYEVTPYDPGSDHDMFNDSTVGVPAMMLGHWPDWTHHTSEDTVDKVDPTTLKRVGVLATAAALWLAVAGEKEGEALATIGYTRAVGGVLETGLRLALPQYPGHMHFPTMEPLHPASRQTRRWARLGLGGFEIVARIAPTLAQHVAQGPNPFSAVTGMLGDELYVPLKPEGPVPRRLFIGPLADSYASTWFREQLGEDYGWWREQARTNPHWEIFVYEVLNFTDGKRSLAEIEDAVEAEFGPIPDGVVEHILRDLEKVRLVEFAAPKQD